MKYAIIGCGRISTNHIGAAIKNNLDIIALCDLELEKTSEKIKQFRLNKSIKQYTNYKELLEKERPELVAICTESGKHAEVAFSCIDFGCHLIIEKPIALSIADANAIIKKATIKNLKVCVCHQNRFNKSIQKIREAMEENRFGKLIYGTAHVRWNRGKDYYTQAKWRGTWKYDGGALMNQCIHNIDLLRWMMGDEVAEVMAYTDNLMHDYIETEDMGIALVKFHNGSYGIIEGTNNIYPENLEETLYIFGQNGTVKAGGKSVNKIEEWIFGDNVDDSQQIKNMCCENPPNIYGYGHIPLYKDTINAISENRQPYISAESGKNALELVLAIYKSSAERKPVQLPLGSGSTLDFCERFK